MNVRPVILGELGLLSLFDLAQLLALNGATGTLHVTSNHKKGFLRFERGQIANARDERLQEGDDAAFRVFGWRTGSFEFRVEPPTSGRKIEDSTESLMLEAARRLDEAGVTSGGESVTQAVQSHASRFKALHQRHRPIASDPTGVPDRAASFAALQTAGDALLYRPDMKVRLFQASHWHEIGERALTKNEFEELRDTFFDSGTGAMARDFIVREPDREILVSHLPGPSEALFVRSVVQLQKEMREAA